MAAKKTKKNNRGAEESKEGALFTLPKALKHKIKCCADEMGNEKEPKVVFLWVCVTASGLKQGVKGDKVAERPLSATEWLTVVDEAASLGANWFVLSFSTPLSESGDIWDVCRWAQQAHGMMVGLHVKTPRLTRRDLTLVKGLDVGRTRILAREGALGRLKLSEEEKRDIIVWTANPQPDGERPNCQGPTRMIFVNAEGVLYTCGLVEGKDAYKMGHVFDRKLKGVMGDTNLPHHVHSDLHYVTPECDGCPALIANYFTENM